MAPLAHSTQHPIRPVAPEPQLPMDAARRGDPEAWDELVRRYQLPLFTYAAELLRDDQAALDVVQETFARAFRHLGSLRENARFGSWLFGIAHQQVVQSWRRRGRSPFSDEPVPEGATAHDPGPDTVLARSEDAACLLTALDALPEAQRSAVLLHFLEDFSLAEIAEATGTSVGTVKSRIHYAKRALRLALTPSTGLHP